jgi:aromatic ring hydroxylase
MNGKINPPLDRSRTYSVQSDCTGTVVRIDGATFDLVVVDGGRQVYTLRTGNLAITNLFLKKGP